MKKIILLILILTLSIVSCTNNTQEPDYPDNNEEKSPEESMNEEKLSADEEVEIDRSGIP